MLAERLRRLTTKLALDTRVEESFDLNSSSAASTSSARRFEVAVQFG